MGQDSISAQSMLPQLSLFGADIALDFLSSLFVRVIVSAAFTHFVAEQV
jgi:hypothetical protein